MILSQVNKSLSRLVEAGPSLKSDIYWFSPARLEQLLDVSR